MHTKPMLIRPLRPNVIDFNTLGYMAASVTRIPTPQDIAQARSGDTQIVAVEAPQEKTVPTLTKK